jgi:hypothetical protein
MSLTRVGYDQSIIDREVANDQKIFEHQMYPYDMRTSPQGGNYQPGIFVDRVFGGQSQVDAESLLRNSAFISSRSASGMRDAANAEFQRFQATSSAAASSASSALGLAPAQVEFNARACHSGLENNRLDASLYFGRGTNYGYGTIPVDTVAAYKQGARAPL